MGCWEFRLLGDFVAIAPDSTNVVLPGKKQQAIIAMVLLSKEKRISREKLLGALWGSRSDDQARASLRGALSGIKRICNSFGGSPLGANRSFVFLSDNFEFDVDVSLIQPSIVLSNDAELRSLISLSGEDFLTSLKINECGFEEWKDLERENFRRDYRHILLNLLKGESNSKNSEIIANRLLTMDDADEEAHRALMQFYASAGNRSMALRQFETCRKKTREHYGSDVSTETQILFEQIKSDSEKTELIKEITVSGAVKSMGTGALDVSLAIMPFGLSSDSDLGPDSGWLIGRDIAGAASKFKWFRVLSTRESFKFDINEIGSSGVSEKTGAKYILDGMITGRNKQYQLTVELIDGFSNSTVWTISIDLDETEIKNTLWVNEKIVGQLDVRLRSNEIRYAHALNRQAASGYECTLLALSNMYEMLPSSYDETEKLFIKAVNYSPNNSWFYSFWALWKMFSLGQNWVDDASKAYVETSRLAKLAMKRDPDDALALVIAGHYESFWEGNLVQGRRLVDASLKLNPYSSFAWMLSSATYSYSGQAEEALSRLEKSYSLCPVETHFMFMYDSAACIAHLFARNPERAEKFGRQTVSDTPDFSNGYKQLLVALGHQKKKKECRRYLARLLELEPDFNITRFLETYPFGKEDDRQYFGEGLVEAGAPLVSDDSKSRLSIVE
ncbi:MAG: DNA-binding SARP family transcriptional activator [Gammaproteobacteria bacterium]|jgi:DNA-binding SARP family transcriptional activator